MSGRFPSSGFNQSTLVAGRDKTSEHPPSSGVNELLPRAKVSEHPPSSGVNEIVSRDKILEHPPSSGVMAIPAAKRGKDKASEHPPSSSHNVARRDETPEHTSSSGVNESALTDKMSEQPSTSIHNDTIRSVRRDGRSEPLPSTTVVDTRRDESSEHPPSSSPINIVLFGETGVGKSSVINLIAGKALAKVSADVDGCTMSSTKYDILVDSQPYAVYDTVGLEEPQMGVNGYYDAIEKAYLLIKSLGEAGGIHLLLFCMRGGRITATAQSNYRLFHEFLCDKQVPIALVFTGLEREQKMEAWWERNQASIKRFGIHSVGHACITAVQDPDDREQVAKYNESRGTLLSLLQKCTESGTALSMDTHNWLAMLLKGMTALLPRKRVPKQKDYTRVLTKRCGMEPDAAKRVAGLIKSGDR